ncbi:hypothetical protein [Mycobacterium sp. SMC-19]|uniref:hypothetical protein n=1 Tax=Mycobacterium sp. SMC-19 TaxID=3381630 RepID=UPI003877349D
MHLLFACEDGAVLVFTYLSVAIVVAIIAWWFGSAVARFAGILLMGFGVSGMFWSGLSNYLDAAAISVVTLLIGVMLWLAGHWMYAYKHHAWRGPFVQRLFNQTPLRRLDPTRGWGHRVIQVRRDS